MMTDLTQGRAAEDRSTPNDTAKLAMFPLSTGGVRFIIMEHPSNKQLAYVDISREGVEDMLNHDLPKLLRTQQEGTQ